MSKERYDFSNEMKEKARKKAEMFNPRQQKDVHHIFPKSLAKKYGVPSYMVKTEKNAIALEKDTFHAWIHGKRLNRKELIDLLGDEISQLERQIDDQEIEWKGLTEEDFIFLAVAYLGINESYFYQPQKRKPVQ